MTENQESPRTLLAALIAREQLTYAEAATRVERASADTGDRPIGLTARHLGRLARAERASATPNPTLARALAAAFGRPAAELLAPYDPAALAPVPSGALTVPANTAEVVTMAADRARRFAQLETASDDLVDLIYDDVRELVQAYPNRPLHELLGHMSAGQDQVFSLLERPQRPEHTRRLYFLGGVLGGLLAKSSHDLADPHAAQVQARTAWLCADAADHHGLRSWIAGLQSLVAYWARRPHDSIRYAQRGAEFAERARSTAGVWLAANEARAWGALGNTAKARDAISRADEAWSRVAADDLDELGGVATFSRPRQLYYAADALAQIPDAAAATLNYSAQAVDAYSDPFDPDWAFGDAAGSRCDLAIGRLRGGDVEGAAEAMIPVLALPPEQRINGIVLTVNRVHSALSPLADATGAVALQQQIEAFTRTTLQALPR